MAQSVNSADAVLDGLRCSVCLEILKEPKILPCCHTFCRGCLSKLPVMKKPEPELSVRGEQPRVDVEPCTSEHEMADESGEMPEGLFSNLEPSEEPIDTLSSDLENESLRLDSSLAFEAGHQDAVATEGNSVSSDQNVNSDMVDYLTCPQCRAEHRIIGSNSVDGFLTDYIAKGHLEELSTSSVSIASNLKCDGCEGLEPVVAFCEICFEYLCNFCSTAHKRLKKFRKHIVTLISDLDEGFKETIVLHKQHALYFCREHPSEVMQLYCQECDAPVCNKCIISSEHQCHKFVEINSQTRKEVDDKLVLLLNTIDEDLKQHVDSLNYVKRVEKVTSDMGNELHEKINRTFDAYAAELEARRKDLLEKSERKCGAKMKILWSERDCLERTIADIATTQNFTKQMRKCKNDKEYLQLASQVLPRLRKLESWAWTDEKVDDIERYSLDCEESDLTVDLISQACNLEEEEQLPQFKVEFSDYETKVDLGEEQSFTVHVTRGKCCRPWTYIDTPAIDLKHSQSETCDVADISITSVDNLDFINLLQPDCFESMDDKEKWELINSWTVTYTPYCGGFHRLTLTVADEATSRFLTVQGTPPKGSRVMKGPNYRYGRVDGEVVSYDAHLNQVTVKESAGVGRYKGPSKYAWGRNGKYEIQLSH